MRIGLLIVAIACVSLSVRAQEGSKSLDSYNYHRGLEEMKNANYGEALDYFDKEIESNPKNGYAHFCIAAISSHYEEYGRALTSVDLALKYLPKKDDRFVCEAYNVRAAVYLALEDTVRALDDFASAIKSCPTGEKTYEKRAWVYYEQGKYDLADSDYKQLIKLNQGGEMGYMGIGINRNAQKRWDEAIEQFNHVANMYSDYSSAYAFRAEAYIGKEKWAEATDDIIKALSIDGNNKAFSLMQSLEEPALGMLVTKMKIQMAKSPNNAYWPYCIGVLHEDKEKYEAAIHFYEEANRKDADDINLHRIAQCYYKLGNYDKALAFINQAIELDSTKAEYIPFKAEALYGLGRTKDAIAEADKYQELYPDYGFGYYRRGWFKSISGDYDSAIEDFTLSITLDPEFSHSYVSRGDVYARQGKMDLAKADYEKVIEIEDSPEKYECLYYAYHGLGEDDKAIAAIDTIIARTEDKKNVYYDAACLYSRMRNKEKALEYLGACLEMGYNCFNHIRMDRDMDFIRDTEEKI